MPQESGSRTEAVATIREAIDSETISSAESAGLDVDDIIQQQIDKYADYSKSTIRNFAESELRRKVSAEKSDTIKGIVMGSRDRYGKNWPRRHSLVRSNGEHIEVSTWNSSLPTDEGREVEIPIGGAAVTMRCEYDEQYDSYEGTQLDSVREMDHEELVNALSEVAVSPDDLTPADEYETVVVGGTVSYVDSQTLFRDGEPDGEGPVLMEDDRGDLQPHLEISLAKEGQASLRGHLERQAYGRPFIRVTDFMDLLSDAYETREKPGAQAEFVANGIKGDDVFFVGNVNSLEKTRDGDGDPVTYVDIGLTAVVQRDLDGEIDGDQATLGDADDGGEGAAEEDVGEDDSEDDGEGDGQGSEEADGGPAVEDVKDSIETFAELVGEDVSSLTASEVAEKAKGIDAPESVIEHALGQLADGDAGEDAGGEDESDGGDADDDGDGDGGSAWAQLEGLKESGMYQCPGDGCPGKGSSLADLIAHVVEDHDDVDGASEAKDWLEARV